MRCWLARTAERPTDAYASAPLRDTHGGGAGWLAAWRQAHKPARGAAMALAGAFDPDGEPAWASLLLLPRDARVRFDDTAVQRARQRILAEDAFDVVSTLVHDASTFAGSLVAARGDGGAARVCDDPFAVVERPEIVQVGPGLLAAHTALPAPTIERYGSSHPWPGGRFT